MAQSLRLHQPEPSDPLDEVALLTHPRQLERRDDLLLALLRRAGVVRPSETLGRFSPDRIILACCAVIDRPEIKNPGGYCFSILRNGDWQSVVDRRAELFPHLYGQQTPRSADLKLQEMPTPLEFPRGRLAASTSTTAPSAPKPTDQQPTFADDSGNWTGRDSMDPAELSRRISEAKRRLVRQTGA